MVVASKTKTGDGKIYTASEMIDLEKALEGIQSVGHYVFDKLDGQLKHKLLFIDVASGRQWTGGQIKEKVLNVACALKDIYHFEHGTAVCLSFDNSDLILILALAVISLGGIVASAYAKDPYAELLYLARKVEPKFLFCHENNVHWAEQLGRDMGYLIVSIMMEQLDNDQVFNPEAVANMATKRNHFQYLLSYEHSKSPSLSQIPSPCKSRERDVMSIIMSSGTTGKPKAIPVTHLNCLADLYSLTARKGLASALGVNFGCTASLDYVSGRLILFGSLVAGYTSTIMDGFQPQVYLEAIERYKINVVYMGAGSFYNLITYKHLDRYDLSSVKVVFPMGAKIIYLDELEKFLRKYPNIVQLKQGFGASELSGGAMNTMTPDEYLRDPENCGKLFAGMQAKIVDPNTGQLLGPNQRGILHMKGPTLFPGYYDLSQSSRSAADRSPFIQDSSVFDEDGFYITGDLAYFTEDEDLYIVGRLKELMSCRAAKKVLPQELEGVIELHPAVAKVCVVGMPNKLEKTLHCPRAFVVVSSAVQADGRNFHPAAGQLKAPQPANNNDDEDDEQELEFRGNSRLCSLPDELRRSILVDLMQFVNERVGWEKQLTGGLALLDDMPTLRETGKIDKGYLRSLGELDVEFYGDRSSC